MSDTEREWLLRVEAKLDRLLEAWDRFAPLVEKFANRGKMKRL